MIIGTARSLTFGVICEGGQVKLGEFFGHSHMLIGLRLYSGTHTVH